MTLLSKALINSFIRAPTVIPYRSLMVYKKKSLHDIAYSGVTLIY